MTWKSYTERLIKGEISLREAMRRSKTVRTVVYLAESGQIVDSSRLTSAEMAVIRILRRHEYIRLQLLSRTRARLFLTEKGKESLKEGVQHERT